MARAPFARHVQRETVMPTPPRSLLPVAVAAALVVLLASTAGTAQAKEHRSPKGYSVTYPDDWTVASEEEQAAVTEAVRQSPGMQPAARGDTTELDLILAHPVEDFFVENVNVIVGGKMPRVTADAQRQVERETRARMTEAGFQVIALSTTRQTIGGVEVLSTKWERRHPGLAALEQF